MRVDQDATHLAAVREALTLVESPISFRKQMNKLGHLLGERYVTEMTLRDDSVGVVVAAENLDTIGVGFLKELRSRGVAASLICLWTEDIEVAIPERLVIAEVTQEYLSAPSLEFRHLIILQAWDLEEAFVRTALLKYRDDSELLSFSVLSCALLPEAEKRLQDAFRWSPAPNFSFLSLEEEVAQGAFAESVRALKANLRSVLGLKLKGLKSAYFPKLLHIVLNRPAPAPTLELML
ncbi:MAG: hypothetical protein KJ947_11065 [Alphaproteobacteria bacterium]|nr:hypothetical protein [Alphaproteobacteria bacterium]MBU1550097.1 hypothetical protein [Alphaproteobacteria bacterium]MBU2337101.1 hypothetical protein [Alphaproteobacteria bacterium]MBU2389432.1 hypothetical protein [Alphaproteobacteria bacterium]